jgi:hypothetical protein
MADQFTKLAFCKLLDRQCMGELAIVGAHCAADCLCFNGEVALIRLDLREFFSITQLGHFDSFAKRTCPPPGFITQMDTAMQRPIDGRRAAGRRKRMPLRGAARLPARGSAAQRRCEASYSRHKAVCNAPYARVLLTKASIFSSLDKISEAAGTHFVA